MTIALHNQFRIDSATNASKGESAPCLAGIFDNVAGKGYSDWVICWKCFHGFGQLLVGDAQGLAGDSMGVNFFLTVAENISAFHKSLELAIEKKRKDRAPDSVAHLLRDDAMVPDKKHVVSVECG